MHRQSRVLDRRVVTGVFSRASSCSGGLRDVLRRAREVVEIELAHPSGVDGWSSSHGDVGGGSGGGPSLVIEDERVPVTAVEMSVLAGRAPEDEYAQLAVSLVDAVDQLVLDVGRVEALVAKADRLRDGKDLNPVYDWVAQSVGLPFDERWAEVHKRTTFAGYLERPWSEPRPVCRWVYDFVRANRRLPLREEMEQLLRKGKVNVRVR